MKMRFLVKRYGDELVFVDGFGIRLDRIYARLLKGSDDVGGKILLTRGGKTSAIARVATEVRTGGGGESVTCFTHVDEPARANLSPAAPPAVQIEYLDAFVFRAGDLFEYDDKKSSPMRYLYGILSETSRSLFGVLVVSMRIVVDDTKQNRAAFRRACVGVSAEALMDRVKFLHSRIVSRSSPRVIRPRHA